MHCTSCNQSTRVLETRRRPDGGTRRRRECTECERRFSTEEHPDLREVLGKIPESTHAEGCPLEAARRPAILHAAIDENRRRIEAALEEQCGILNRMGTLLATVERRVSEREETRA